MLKYFYAMLVIQYKNKLKKSPSILALILICSEEISIAGRIRSKSSLEMAPVSF